jgi:hypothetical protein
MGQEWVTAKVLLPDAEEGKDQPPREVRFTALPRVGGWLDWGPVARRVMGIAWGGANDDGVLMPTLYLENAPLEQHPMRSPKLREKAKTLKRQWDDED